MNIVDICLTVLIAAAVLLAIRFIYTAKRSGKSCSCGGDCSRCGGCRKTDRGDGS